MFRSAGGDKLFLGGDQQEFSAMDLSSWCNSGAPFPVVNPTPHITHDRADADSPIGVALVTRPHRIIVNILSRRVNIWSTPHVLDGLFFHRIAVILSLLWRMSRAARSVEAISPRRVDSRAPFGFVDDRGRTSAVCSRAGNSAGVHKCIASSQCRYLTHRLREPS